MRDRGPLNRGPLTVSMRDGLAAVLLREHVDLRKRSLDVLPDLLAGLALC